MADLRGSKHRTESTRRKLYLGMVEGVGQRAIRIEARQPHRTALAGQDRRDNSPGDARQQLVPGADLPTAAQRPLQAGASF